jgi:cytosine/adenosine deaminase-related metal-dependent hydrolase
MRDPHTAVVFSAGRGDVRHVLVAGDLVIKDHQSTRVTANSVFAAANEHLAKYF